MTNQDTPAKPRFRSVPAGSLPTVWDLTTYEVWGNAKDGYDVNNSFSSGSVELRIPRTRHNAGTEHEFISAHPTHRQIKKALGVTCRIETDGDDMNVTINRARDGYPLAAIYCTSHASLSPVKALPQEGN